MKKEITIFLLIYLMIPFIFSMEIDFINRDFLLTQSSVLSKLSNAPRIEVLDSYDGRFLNEISQNSLVVFDIDDTLIHHDEKHSYEGIVNFSVIEKEIRKKNGILHILTYRKRKYKKHTFKTLSELGLYKPKTGLIKPDRATFTGGHDKGKALLKVIRKYQNNGNAFDKIVFIDDNPRRVKEVLQRLRRLPIKEAVGFIYQGFVARDKKGRTPNKAGYSQNGANDIFSVIGPCTGSGFRLSHLNNWQQREDGSIESGKTSITSCISSQRLIRKLLSFYVQNENSSLHRDSLTLKCIEENEHDYRLKFLDKEWFLLYQAALEKFAYFNNF